MDQLSNEEFEALAEKWLNGSITPAEEQLFNQWYEQQPDSQIIMESGDHSAEAFRARVLERIKASARKVQPGLGQLVEMGNPPGRSSRKQWMQIAAAIVLVLTGAGTYLYLTRHPQKEIAQTTAKGRSDVAPGGNKAVLTLANGASIVLDSAGNGTLAQQGSVNVRKLDNGQLTYNALHEKPGGTPEILYNTLATPRGGQYQLSLPDGTKVWLNAASSLQYPVSFAGSKQREVTLSGEAYFEVAKNQSKPFQVRVRDIEVEVLGTHFNVMAYPDESALKTTLLEGAVKVINVKSGQSSVLKEGQQAQLKDEQLSVVSGVNTDQVVAWKDGLFDFESVDLQTILRQYARWYNIDIVYEGRVKSKKFYGIVKRNNTLEHVLEMLQDNDIQYRIEGKKLIVISE